MADEDTLPKQAPLTLDSEIFEEASTSYRSDQPDMLGEADQSVSAPSATEANSFGTEIHRVDVTSSDDTTLSNGASGSTADASHGVGGVQEDEQHPTEDDPSNPLMPPRYSTDVGFPIRIVDYEIYEPPPPPRPSWIQCMCCCFLTAYYIHYARKIRNSKYVPHVLIAFFAIPISAFCLGFYGADACSMAPLSPFLLMLSGFLGICLLAVRYADTTRRISGLEEQPPKSTTMGFTIVVMLLLTIEMITFYTKNPNFDNPKDPVYCNKTFYYYLNYMNFVVMAIGIFALLLHIPMKPSDPVQVVPLEYFETI